MEFDAIARSLMASFPYIRAYGSTKGWGIHFFCSMQPIDIPSAAAAAARLPSAAKADLVEWEPASFSDGDFPAHAGPGIEPPPDRSGGGRHYGRSAV